MNGHSFTVDELMCFVKEQYSEIVKGGLNVTDIDYIGILDYLQDNIEVPYSNPEEPGIDPEEKKRIYEVEEKGRAATTELKKMTNEFGRLYKLNNALPVSWLDGSKTKTRKYLSAQMKYSDYSDNPSSISIFVEKNGPSSTRYRISLEIKSDGTDKRSMAKYHSHLDMSCNTAAGLVYVSGSNEWGNPAELTETQEQIKVQVESGDLRKVQICKCIERKDDETNEYYHNEISKAIAALIPYYDHVIGKISTTTDKGWLMTWNPANWEWEGFDKLCVETKNGKTHIEAWNCSSKQPVIGDDVFLMKTGEQPRGIMAHGHIAKASYTAPHYDPEKNVAGVTTGYVDVEFDWIQNYKSEKLLIQDILKKKFPTQNWSPIGSGIEIKECLPELKAMWVELIGKKGNKGGERKMIEFDKNLILYGPPGTGKTYNTAIYAVAICDGRSVDELTDYDAVMVRYNELKNQNRIVFTTFHQSYGYEEFIEGIKPVVDGESPDISYIIEPGIFKKFCKRAQGVEIKNKDLKIADDAEIWKATVRSEVIQDCFENDRIRIDWGFDSEGAAGFVNGINKGDIILTTDGSRSFINGIAVVIDDEAFLLDDESDTTTRSVKWLAKNINENIKSINSNRMLHRKTCSKVPNMKISDVLKLAAKLNPEISDTKIEKDTKPYVFIIDEINRGNISKIFGELITLIENTKREGMPEAASTTLPYSGESFSVPSNVYILGTMNTADRSIALMDTALRRRFQFKEMMPEVNVLRKIGADKVTDGVTELDVVDMLKIINERITFLYDREHTIGHAFFTGLKDAPSIDMLASVFLKSVVPLLQEYFYEDYQKIQLVLGDNAKTDDNLKFIKDVKVVVKNVFKGNVDEMIDFPEKKYVINKNAFYNIQSYIQIM